MKYKSVIVTAHGGPEMMQVVENELREPEAGETRIRILAAPVCLPDVQSRYGKSPFPPKMPFTPGYAFIGEAEAIGRDVSGVKVGDRVAALTAYGSYAEYIHWDADKLIPVPKIVDPAEAVTLILNYIVAYQTMHRSAKVKTGEKVLIIGASGGIGTALMQLGALMGLKMYGLASPEKHHILSEYGVIPIDYHTQDFVEVVREAEPDGLDAVFDGIGGDYFARGFSLLRRGGVLVGYGNPLSVTGMLKMLGQLLWFNLIPNWKSVKLYGTGASYINRKPFMEDWAELFKLLKVQSIKPVIAAKFPILEAARANELLESGDVIGNVVLLAPELL